MKQLAYLKNVTTLSLDESKCTGCKTCGIVCPHCVFSFATKKARIENKDFCMECGACAKNCKDGALYVQTGVGCANAVINSTLGRQGDCCC